MRDASHRGSRSTSAPRDLLIVHSLVNESRHLESLTHGIKFVGRAYVAQKRRHHRGIAQSRERVDQLVEASRRFGFGVGGNYLACGHFNMIACYYATMQLIPAIDLLGDDAVRLEQGDYDRVIFRKPLDEFVARVVATAPPLIHLVDLQGARDGDFRTDIVQRCVAIAGTIPVQVSGGIRTLDTARAALEAGAARVIVGTALWDNPDALAHFVDALAEQLVAAIDVRDGQLAVRGWQSSSGVSVDDALDACLRAGVRRLHVTAIARDGMMQGPDLDLYSRACASGLPVVAAGGVRDDEDVERLGEIGCEAAIMGVGFLARLGLRTDSSTS
jgi:phosphoribosylformimino-5-aminoimidazole carboxamide ribotide isomerase